MDDRPIPNLHDDPFEWLGRGVLMDQSSHADQQPKNNVPAHHSTSDGDNEPAEDLGVTHISREDDPFEMMGRDAWMGEVSNGEGNDNPPQSINTTKQPTSDYDDPFESLVNGMSRESASNTGMCQQSTNATSQPISEVKTDSEIIVEDVFSVDGSQSGITDVPDSDRSYVVQELFPSMKSPKPNGVPSTIYEDSPRHPVESVEVSTDNTNMMRSKQSILPDAGVNELTPPYLDNHIDQFLRKEVGKNEATDSASQNQPNNLIPIIVGDNSLLATDGCTGHANQSQQPIRNIGSSNLLLSFNETPPTSAAPITNLPIPTSTIHDNCLETDLLQLPSCTMEPIGPLNDQMEQVAPCSLYEEPPTVITSSLSHVGVSGSALHTSHLPFGLPMGSPSPNINRRTSEELNLEPSAAATIATVASTTYDDDTDSDNSEPLLQEKVNVSKNNSKRRVEESYALFNDENAQPNHTARNDISDDDSLDCREEFLTSTKKRQRPSLIGNKQVDISLGSDEEAAISPGRVGYTGFDENDEKNPKKSGTKSHYKTLRGSVLADAKPKTKKFIVICAIVVIALITAVSILISLVVKSTEKSALASPNESSRVESGDVDIVSNPGNESINTSANNADSNVTSSNPTVVESTSPSSLPSMSILPSLSRDGAASYDTTVHPSESPVTSTEFPTYSTLQPTSYTTSSNPTTISTSSNHPSYSGTTDSNETELIEMPSDNSSNSTPTIFPTNPPTIFSSAISHNLSSTTCNSSTAINTSELQSIWSDDKPCADFVVELCIDEYSSKSEWAIIRFFPAENTAPSSFDPLPPLPPIHEYIYDDWYNDDLYDDLYTDEDLNNLTSRLKTNTTDTSNSDERAYYLDQDFSINGGESAIVCLQKGFYHFIIHESLNVHSYSLIFGNGRPIRPMSVANYSDNIEVTPFEVTDFDLLGVSANLTVPYPLPSQSTESSTHEINTTSLVTSSGTDLIHDISKAYGILFDVEIGELPLIITSIELYIDTSFPTYYEVHTKDGSWKSDEVLSGFQQVSHGNIVGGGVCQDSSNLNCTFARIPNDDLSLFLPSMSRQSFYVTLTTDDLVFQHRSEYGNGGIDFVDIVQVSKPELTVYIGAAVLQYPLESADPTTDFRPGGFIGRLIYQVVEEDSDPYQYVSFCF
jgi:hypothetical protein